MSEDVLAEGLSIVFCGVAEGQKPSWRSGHFAGRSNRFWQVLHEVGLTPRELKPGEAKLLPSFGLGLVDLNRTKAGTGAGAYDDGALEAHILHYQPKILCFNGKEAALRFLRKSQVDYGLYADRYIGASLLFVAPSTAARNQHWDARYWLHLAELARSLAG